jgi:hypothetical protein
MTKFFLRPLLLSNYSLAVAITGWKAEKIFPRAILITGLQLYLLISAAIILFHPKVKTLDQLWFLAGELGITGLFLILLLRPFATWLYIKLNVLSQYKSRNTEKSDIRSSVAFSLAAIFIWVGSIVFAFYISTN